jgi:hypothetical protein
LAQKYAALAHESEERGNHRGAAELYRAALFILYNIPPYVLEVHHARGVPQNDTEARMPSDATVRVVVHEQSGAENSVPLEMTRESS